MSRGVIYLSYFRRSIYCVLTFCRTIICIMPKVRILLYIISAWAILLFVQQYRALLTVSECGSDNGRFTLFVCNNAILSRILLTDMNIDGCISEDIHTSGGGEIPPSAGLTSNALPEAQSCKKQRVHIQGCPPTMHFRKTLPIGMLYAALTAEKRPHTSI